jgi:hypothetical protein
MPDPVGIVAVEKWDTRRGSNSEILTSNKMCRIVQTTAKAIWIAFAGSYFAREKNGSHSFTL